MRISVTGLAAAVALLGLLTAGSAAQGAWPNTTVWPTGVSDNVYAVKGPTQTPIRDINGDQSPTSTDTGSHGAADATGDWNTAYLYFDGTNLFFRVLLNASPGTAGNLAQFAWLVEIDANLNGTSDWLLGVDGVGEQVEVECLATGVTTVIGSSSTYTRVVDTGVASLSNKSSNMYYLDWQVPLSSLSDAGGACADLTASTVFRPFFGTSASFQNINKDYFTGTSVDYTALGYVTANNTEGSTATGVPVR